jgi:plasmid stabilization system protein ParE
MTYAETRPQSLVVPIGLTGLALVLVAIFVFVHSRYLGVPSYGTETGGWRDWADQSKYIEAARAWAEWDLTPARHWYPPGYSLLAAPFLWVTPHDRFLLPNLACMLTGQFACAALARRMFPQHRYAALWGAGAFLVVSESTIPALRTWIVPWTTTPAAALTLAALVAVLRLAEHPGIGRALFAGGAIGGIVFFRPSDAAPVAFAAALTVTPGLLAMPIRYAAGVVAAAVLAAAAASGTAAAVIAATSGFGPGTYYDISAKIGFEFRLLPLRWVSLVIDGHPLFDGVGTDRLEPSLHRGLSERFPWIIAGVGGAAACWFGRDARRVHVLLVTWLAAHMALTLAYRDLHILSLWLLDSDHYFKVTQPIFLLYALLLIVRLADRATRWRAASAAGLVIVLGFGWRAGLTPMHADVAPASADGVAIPSLERVDEAAIVRGTGPWNAFYLAPNILTIDGTRFLSRPDFKIYPRSRDFLVVPLRPLPPDPGVLTVAAGIHVEAGVPAIKVLQTITFGLPCAFGLAGSAVCGSVGVPLIPSQ